MSREAEKKCSEERREFLGKSAYAAYATPAITAMLVDKASAAKSTNPGRGRVTPNPQGPYPTPPGANPDPGKPD